MDMKTLLAKSSKRICTVKEDSNLKEVIELLFDENVNAALVADVQEQLCGLITEHDIVMAVNEHGENVVNIKAGDVMEIDLVVCTPDTTLKDALAMMSDNNIRHLPVLTPAGHLLGFVGIVEVMREFLLSLDVIGADEKMKETVGHIM